MRLFILSLSLVIFCLPSFAIEIACEHALGKQSAFIIDGQMEVEENKELTRTVYSITEDAKVTVLESSEGVSDEQRVIDGLNWARLGNGFIGTGFVEFDGISGAGTHYIDENQEVTSAIMSVNGVVVSGSSSSDCERIK